MKIYSGLIYNMSNEKMFSFFSHSSKVLSEVFLILSICVQFYVSSTLKKTPKSECV